MKSKYGKNEEDLSQVDAIDRKILNILAGNARTKLTVIARQIGLSIDSTKKRIEKLEKNKIILKYTIQAHMGKLGTGLAVHVYVKLKDLTKEKYENLIKDLSNDYRVVDLVSMLGDYDLFIVLLGRDTIEMDEMKMEIRQKFGSLIGEWKEVVVSKLYKLEEYKF